MKKYELIRYMKLILNERHLLNEVNSWSIAVVTIPGRKEDC